MADKVRLRGHHLLCILNYGGAGYTEKFIENMSAIVARINEGAAIEIVSGADAICGVLRRGGEIACDHAKQCRSQRVKNRDTLALKDVARALRMPELGIGSVFTFGKSEAGRLRRLFARNAIRHACVRCEWHARCSERAANRYAGAKLFPPE